MTIVRKYKRYNINNRTYFVEQYADKPHFVWFWRYGIIHKSENGSERAQVYSDMLRTRPNLKRLNLG